MQRKITKFDQEEISELTKNNNTCKKDDSNTHIIKQDSTCKSERKVEIENINESETSQTIEKLHNFNNKSPTKHSSYVTVNNKPGNYIFKKIPNYNKSKEDLKMYGQTYNPQVGVPSLFQNVGNYNNYNYIEYKNNGIFLFPFYNKLLYYNI